MTDKTEKILKIISIALSTAVILILAVVIGLFLSSAFRIFDMVHDDTQESIPEDTRSKVSFQGIEIPVPDNMVVDSTASARNFLDGITDWNAVGEEAFFEGIHRNHADGQNPISLEDLTAYDFITFMKDVFYQAREENEKQQLPFLDDKYPIEVLIPVDEKRAIAVYRLLDGTTEVYVYIDIYYASDEWGEEYKTRWFHNPYCLYVTERLTLADMASLQVGDTIQQMFDLCPAAQYPLDESGMTNPYVAVLEEGILYAWVDDAALKELSEINREHKNKASELAKWKQKVRITDITFIPFGNVLTEEEKAMLIEKNPKYKSFMEYSSIPYMLLPE